MRGDDPLSARNIQGAALYVMAAGIKGTTSDSSVGFPLSCCRHAQATRHLGVDGVFLGSSCYQPADGGGMQVDVQLGARRVKVSLRATG